MVGGFARSFVRVVVVAATVTGNNITFFSQMDKILTP